MTRLASPYERLCKALALWAFLSALLAAGASAQQADVTSSVKALYDQGKTADASRILRDHLSQSPNDAKARMLLAVVSLKAGNEAGARIERDRLAAMPMTPAISVYVNQLDKLFASKAAQAAFKRQVLEGIKKFDVAGVTKAVQQLDVNQQTRSILMYYVEAYQGLYGDASKRPFELPTGAVRQRLLDDLNARSIFRREYLDWQLYVEGRGKAIPRWARTLSPDIEFGEFARIALTHYAEALQKLHAAAPLSREGQEAAFLSALYFKPYQEFESVADAVLASTGQITLRVSEPMTFGFRLLTIDGKKRTVSLDAPEGRVSKNYPPFTLQLDTVREISQTLRVRALRTSPDLMLDRVDLLQFKPTGRVPQLQMTYHLFKGYGPDVAAQSLNHLGQYVARLTGNKKVKFKPAAVSMDTGGFARTMNAIAGGMAQANGDMAAAARSAAEEERYQQREQQGQAAIRNANAAGDAFFSQADELVAVAAFGELDELIRTIN